MRAITVAVIFLTALAGAAAQDGETDLRALFGEGFPGAEIVEEGGQNYDEATFYTDVMADTFAAGPSIVLEGRTFFAFHAAPEERSALEVFRAYERSLKSKDFTEIYACANLDCGGDIATLLFRDGLPSFNRNRSEQRYGVYERTVGAARQVVSLFVTKPGAASTANTLLFAVDTDATEDELETLDASGIAAAIEAGGAAAIYGLEFATGSADLLPASEPVIAQMAGYLQAKPDVSILLVGHTDNQGGLTLNMDLSQRRAMAVRQALIDGHAIAGGRLDAHGVGYLAPKATNADEAGRAKNRRVEMVLR